MKPLEIGILDFDYIRLLKVPGRGDASTKKAINTLREAVKKMGYIPKIYKVEKCQLYFNNRKAEILYRNKKIKGCDVLVPRVAITGDVDLEISIVKQFQMMGIPVVNKYLPIARAKNKLRTLQMLTHRNIPVPPTLVVRKLEYVDDAIKKVGGYPVIIKSPFGTFGVGVVLVESRRSLYSALDILWKNTSSNILLIQEYIEEANGTDYRAYVIGDKIVASMQRAAAAGEFRSNLHLGGEGTPVILTPEEQKLAIRASQTLGLDIAGVDILRTKKGPLIMEVNANPGFLGISQVTGIDVASEIVKFAASQVKKKS